MSASELQKVSSLLNGVRPDNDCLACHQWDSRVEDDYAVKRGHGIKPLATIGRSAYTAHDRSNKIRERHRAPACYLHGFTGAQRKL